MTVEMNISDGILKEKDISINIIGYDDGRIRGYELNSYFYWKKDKKDFKWPLKEN